MTAYTSVGSGLWSWEPFRRLERSHDDIVGRCTKLFWLWAYTSEESKRLVPGLFVGSVTTMAESARIPVDAARTYLDRLLEDDLVEYDVENRVLRLTVLPDCGESPANGKAILGWWRRFQTVPECGVRDAHVITLRWIMDEWCRRNAKQLSNGHQEAWAETFGRVRVPTPRRRRPKHVQTDLFTASDPVSKQINNFDSNTIPTRVGRDPDPDRDQDQDPDLREGGPGGGAISAPTRKPVLTLVPHPAFDADDLAETLNKATAGNFPSALTREQRIALGRAIDAIGDHALHPNALALLGEYVASLHELRAATGMASVTLEVVTSPGWLAAAIGRGAQWQAQFGTEVH